MKKTRTLKSKRTLARECEPVSDMNTLECAATTAITAIPRIESISGKW
jgi:hypothetical protein